MKENEMNKTDLHEKCIVIRVKQETKAELGSLYDAVRWCWRISIDRAQESDYVLAVVNYGTREFKVEQVFKPSEWHCITANECKDKIAPICTCKKKPCGRIGFTGKRAETEIEKKYLGKKIPMGQNPVIYLY